jgi:hypothetical protein
MSGYEIVVADVVFGYGCRGDGFFAH